MYAESLAFKYDKEAAEQGNAHTQYQLGYNYERKESYDQSVFWYRKAVEQGHIHAQYYLGNMYDQGRCVEQDFEKAVFFWRIAAALGHAASQNILNSRNITWNAA
jgi:TPR repeat protein